MRATLTSLIFILITANLHASNTKSNQAQTVLNFISYDSIGSTRSGEVLLLIENLIQNHHSQLQLVEIQKGVAFVKNSLYLLTGEDKSDEQMNALTMAAPKSTQKFIAYETDRSILMVPIRAPEKFHELLRSKRNTAMAYQSDYRYWYDLRWNTVTGGELNETKYSFFDMNRKDWNVNSKWDNSFYFHYKLRFENETFTVSVLPKSFGGLPRLVSVLKNTAKLQPIIFSTGEITPDLNDPENSEIHSFDELERFQNQYAAVAFSDLFGLKTTYADFLKKWNDQPPIHFLSANICEKKSKPCKSVYSQYKIIERSGLKIAIIGVTSPSDNILLEKYSVKYPWLKDYEIRDSNSILSQELIPTLKPKVDLIIVVTNANLEEQAKLTPYLSGVDFIVKKRNRVYGWESEELINFNKFKTRFPQTPIAEIKVSDISMIQSSVNIKDDRLQYKASRIPLDQKLSSDSSYVDHWLNLAPIFSGNDIVLPDHKKLYPNNTHKVIVSKEEFALLAAEVMRSGLTAEVGIFNIQNQRSNIIGEQDASVIRSWMMPEEQIEVLYLHGSDLKQLVAENDANKTEEFRLAIAGTDNSGQIDGLPIQDSEIYRVVTSSIVSNNVTKFPVLSRAVSKNRTFTNTNGKYLEHPQGRDLLLVDYLIQQLREHWKMTGNLEESQRYKFYRDLYEGRSLESNTGYWVHEIKGLRLEYSSLYTTDVSSFGSVQDSRLQSVDQKMMTGNLGYLATYRKHPYISEWGLKALYAKQELSPVNAPIIVNSLGDEIVASVNIGFPVYKNDRLSWLGNRNGPIAELAYNTEFEKDSGQELKKNLQTYLGWRFYNGSIIQNATLAYLLEKRMTTGKEKNENGLSLQFELQHPLAVGQALFKSDFNYRFYFGDEDDSTEDVRSRIVWDNYLDVKITDRCSFGPYFKLFTLQGKTFNSALNQSMIGVNFSFAGMWKPKFNTSVY